MYDDHNRELKRLENELLREEMTNDEFEAFYNEICNEFGPPKEDYLEGSPVNMTYDSRRNARPPKAAPRQYQTGASPAYGGALEDEAPVKEKSIRGLVICACFECLAIAAVTLWWVFRIL